MAERSILIPLLHQVSSLLAFHREELICEPFTKHPFTLSMLSATNLPAPGLTLVQQEVKEDMAETDGFLLPFKSLVIILVGTR